MTAAKVHLAGFFYYGGYPLLMLIITATGGRSITSTWSSFPWREPEVCRSLGAYRCALQSPARRGDTQEAINSLMADLFSHGSTGHQQVNLGDYFAAAQAYDRNI